LSFDTVPAPQEPLCRFIFSRRYFSSGRVKAAAYLPEPGPPRETSILRTDGLQELVIWDLGTDMGAVRRQTLYARGDTTAQVVYDAGLEIDPDNVPERHATIRAWPEEKDAQLELARELARNSTLVQPPNGPIRQGALT
jgi:hypothetical protein